MKKLFALLPLLLLFALPSRAQIGSRSFTTTIVANDVGIGNIGSGIAFHQISWNPLGVVSTCQARLQGSADNITYADIIANQTCTAAGQSTVVNSSVNYIKIEVTTLSGGGSVTVHWNGFNAAPSGGGTVTSLTATSPIVVTPSPVTGTGVISCPTCGTSTGTVTSFSAGDLSPLFTSSVATPTTTPAHTFTQVSQAANLVFAGPSSGGAVAPTFRALVAADIPTALTVPINNVVSATGAIATIADGNNPLVLNCALTSGTTCLTTGETTAATTASAVEDQITTLDTSTAIPLKITQGANGPAGAAAPAYINANQPAVGGAASGAQSGFAGAFIRLSTGGGSAAGPTGTTSGQGGQFVFVAGDASFTGCTLTTCAGGNAAGMNFSTGNGGRGGATGNGGLGGNFQVTTNNGGNAGVTSGTGGHAGNFLFTAGNGGSAAVGSTTGQGGSATFTLGAAGGTGTAGLPGIFTITGQTVGGANTSALLSMTETWNTTGVVDAGILLNVTNSASGAGSKLMDLKVANAAKFSVDVTGNAAAVTYSTPTNLLISSTAPSILAAGCGGAAASISANNGTAAFRVGVGTSNTGTCTITMPTAAVGWNCMATDLTTKSTTVADTRQTSASNATTLVLQNYTDIVGTGAWTDNDTLSVVCMAD